MSASGWNPRASFRKETRAGKKRPAARSWIGIDVSEEDDPRRARALLPLLVLALIAALGVAALRIDLIRIRYAMASGMADETMLIDEQRTLIVRMRELRDPVKLAIRARELGFRPPAQIFSLPDPLVAGDPPRAETNRPPSVATRPGTEADGSEWQ